MQLPSPLSPQNDSLKTFFLYFPKNTWPEKVSYIFKKGILRARTIFRILSNIYDRTFYKNSYLALHLEKIFYNLISKTFFYFLKRNIFLNFRKRKHRKKMSYISGNFLFFKTELSGSTSKKNLLLKCISYSRK